MSNEMGDEDEDEVGEQLQCEASPIINESIIVADKYII